MHSLCKLVVFHSVSSMDPFVLCDLGLYLIEVDHLETKTTTCVSVLNLGPYYVQEMV